MSEEYQIYKKASDARIMLMVHGLITDNENIKIKGRLLKYAKKHNIVPRSSQKNPLPKQGI